MPAPSPSTWPAQLEAFGWFRFVDAARAAEAKREIVERAYVLAGEVKRQFHADAEDLAEDGILSFLGGVLPFLRREGVAAEATFGRWKRPAGGPPPDPDEAPGPIKALRLSIERDGPLVEVTSDFGEDGYVVGHGDRRFVAWEASDAGSSWTSATVAMLDLVNTLLTAHGSDERAWALMGGNDLFVVFATEAACRFINATLGSSEQLHDGTKG